MIPSRQVLSKRPAALNPTLRTTAMSSEDSSSKPESPPSGVQVVPQASTTSSGTSSALCDRGNTAARRGDWKEAVLCYTLAIAGDPGDSRAWSNRALAHLQSKDALLAAGDATHVLEAWKPQQAKAGFRLARAYEAMESYDEAISMYRLCISFAGGNTRDTRSDVAERIAACTTAHAARRKAHMTAPIRLAEGAHAGTELDAAAQERFVANAMAQGIATLRGEFRAYTGGPRDPAVVIAAFRPLLSTRLVELRAVEGVGVGVFAIADIPRGTRIHWEQPLLAAGMDPAACYHCTARGTHLPCRNACDRRYCSPACEAAAWAAYHAPLCAAAGGKAVARLQTKAAAGSTASARFILLMWKMVGAALVAAANTGKPVRPPADCGKFIHMARNTDLRSPEDTGDHRMGAAFLLRNWHLFRDLMGPELAALPAFSIGWVSAAVTLLAPNVLGMTSSGDGHSVLTCAQALLGAGTLFNHSCVPNVHDESAAPLVVFTANRRIAAGEECTIAYVDTVAPRDARQGALRGQYGFTCTCAKCAAGT